MKVLVGCERSGKVRDAFARLGHEVLSCDIEPTDTDGPHYQGDVFDVIDFPWDLGLFFFPCTHSSVSGARWFADKKRDGSYYAGNALWLKGWRRAMHIPRVAFEHPVSVISSLFRQPDQVIQPWMFGHGEVKATCLWLRGLPLLTPTNIVEGRAPRVHYMPPGEDRARLRSETYTGIAEAMAAQWGAENLEIPMKATLPGAQS